MKTTSTKTRKTPTGTVKVLGRRRDGAACKILINNTEYRLDHLADGFRLMRFDEESFTVKVYDLTSDLKTCTCPDAVNRHRECKHCRGLKALSERGRLVVSVEYAEDRDEDYPR